ncbi:host attachment protein [Methylobacterium phyllosphaerae]
MAGKRNLMIPHGGYVIVADGRKVLVLLNEGHPLELDLQVRRVFEAPPNPPTRDQGTDKPPRVRLGDRRSAIEQTDWHELAERRFTDDVAQALDRLEPVPALVVVAPQRTLAELRLALPERLRRSVIAEIDRDLTKHTVSEIQRHLRAA